MTIDLAAFKNPALQFSGGKDSLACLGLLGEQLDRVGVYWLNTGDTCPETLDVIAEVRTWIPNFIEVRSDVASWRDTYGMPSDLIPAKSHFLGKAYGMSDTRVSNRFDCCYYNLMLPMHRRMIADGVDAVIRGTKLADTGKVPAEGPGDGYHVILPIRDWSHAQVFEYLRQIGAPENKVYEHFKNTSAPECLHCTAWWDDGKSAYLKQRHPAVYNEYVVHLSTLRDLMRSHLADLDNELTLV